MTKSRITRGEITLVLTQMSFSPILLPQNPDFALIMLFFTTTYAFKTGFTRTSPHIPILYEISQVKKCILRFFLLPEYNLKVPVL